MFGVALCLLFCLYLIQAIELSRGR